MIRKVALLGLLASTVALSACNTARGVKEDVNSASGAIERSTDGKPN